MTELTQALKGHLDSLLLAVVQRQSLHGYAIVEALRDRSGGAFDLPEGSVYGALHRLEAAGLVDSQWSTSIGARRRRVYSLTQRGESALTADRAVWRRFSGAVDRLLGDAS